ADGADAQQGAAGGFAQPAHDLLSAGRDPAGRPLLSRMASDRHEEGIRDGSAAARGAEADLSHIRTIPVASRPNKVQADQFATPPSSFGDGRGFADFLASLPRVLQAESLLDVADAIASAVERGRAVVWMLGGHVVKTGIAPL